MIILRPLCPACQTRTMLARITPGPSGFDIRTFECLACAHVHQRAVELVDPMKSPETARWLRGELHAPTSAMPALDDIAKAGSKTFDRVLSLVAALIVVAIIVVARY